MSDDDTFPEHTTDQEALKLVLAFYCILEADKRDALLALAKRYASNPQKTAFLSDDWSQRLI
jgi:hypothetical protein